MVNGFNSKKDVADLRLYLWFACYKPNGCNFKTRLLRVSRSLTTFHVVQEPTYNNNGFISIWRHSFSIVMQCITSSTSFRLIRFTDLAFFEIFFNADGLLPSTAPFKVLLNFHCLFTITSCRSSHL